MYLRFDGYILARGFVRSFMTTCVSIWANKNGHRTYLLLYVDDMLIISDSLYGILIAKHMLQVTF